MGACAINTMNEPGVMAAEYLKGNITAHKVMRLVNAGISVYAISEATGIPRQVLQELVDSYEDTA